MAGMGLNDLLGSMVERNASDLHLKAGRPPLLRIERELFPVEDEELDAVAVQELIRPLLNDRQRRHLDEKLWVELGYTLPDVSRFRVSITHQRGTLLATFRRIPLEFPSLDDWGLPEVLKDFAKLDNGIVLITGPAGSGKSSTLAALLRLVSETRRAHVMTIEDPIEFLIGDDLGSVSQREIGTDTLDFHEALRNALRQDPDVIAVGEMRDLETIATALTAAETGHLVFSTLHTISAAETVDRLIDSFPGAQQDQIRAQIGRVLRGIVSLRLVPRRDGGLVAAVEILKQTPRLSKLIASGEISEIEPEIEDSVSFYRMQSLNQSLMALVMNGIVSKETAQEACTNLDDFDREMRKAHFALDTGEKGEPDMSDSPADYSKIVELTEIKKLYEESEERHNLELQEQQRLIQSLHDRLEEQENQLRKAGEAATRNKEGLERSAALVRERDHTIAELEAKLSASAQDDRGPRRLFSRRS